MSVLSLSTREFGVDVGKMTSSFSAYLFSGEIQAVVLIKFIEGKLNLKICVVTLI